MRRLTRATPPREVEAIHAAQPVAKDRTAKKCPLCRAAGLLGPRITLAEKDVAALRQFVERVERMTAFVRELLGER